MDKIFFYIRHSKAGLLASQQLYLFLFELVFFLKKLCKFPVDNTYPQRGSFGKKPKKYE